MDKKGSVLMISLWIMTILVVFALGLGHRAAINLRLARYQKDRLKAACLARAGINRAIVEIEKDDKNYDSLKDKWADNKEIFEKIILKQEPEEDPVEFATVGYKVKDAGMAEEQAVYGVMDEERKININIASPAALAALLKESKDYKFNDAQADEIAHDIRIWRGDTGIDEGDEKYKNFKKAPFSNPEESIIVLEYFFQNKNMEDYKDKAQEAFNAVKDLITVWGAQVNANTASEAVLTILTGSIADANEIGYVPDVIREIKKERESKYFEKINDIGQGVSGDAYYVNLFNKLKIQQPQLINVTSNNFKIESTGNVGQTIRKIAAIYDRANKKMNYWHEN